jgi:hypothetical protein
MKMYPDFSEITQIKTYVVQLLVTDSYTFCCIRLKFNINIQTHHSIKTAYKLVPGIFYRIILLKKMPCCTMEMKLGC